MGFLTAEAPRAGGHPPTAPSAPQHTPARSTIAVKSSLKTKSKSSSAARHLVVPAVPPGNVLRCLLAALCCLLISLQFRVSRQLYRGRERPPRWLSYTRSHKALRRTSCHRSRWRKGTPRRRRHHHNKMSSHNVLQDKKMAVCCDRRHRPPVTGHHPDDGEGTRRSARLKLNAIV
jgi:hypothetical protein